MNEHEEYGYGEGQATPPDHDKCRAVVLNESMYGRQCKLPKGHGIGSSYCAIHARQMKRRGIVEFKGSIAELWGLRP